MYLYKIILLHIQRVINKTLHTCFLRDPIKYYYKVLIYVISVVNKVAYIDYLKFITYFFHKL